MINNETIVELNQGITNDKNPIPMVTFQDDVIMPNLQPINDSATQNNYSQYNHSKFAKEFMARNSVVKIQGILYLYLYDRGYYHPLIVGASDIPVRMQMPNDMQDHCNNTTINEMIKWLYAWIEEYTGVYNEAEYVNFKNGYLNITSNELHSHSSDVVFTYVLNVDYVSGMKETPVFDEFLSNICDGQIGLDNLLAEHFGYIISSIRSVKLISIFYGPSNTGKSTWLELLNLTIGDDFTRAIPLQNISGNFRTIELLGSRLNTFSEVDNFKLNDTYMIKTLSSGGDRINCDVKNGKPIDFVNLAALVFASNTLENFKLVSKKGAIYERLLIIPFLNQINTNNRIIGLLGKLKQELPYIVKKFALPGLHRFYSNYYEFTDSKLIEQIKYNLLKTDNSVFKFLSEYCEFGEDLRVSTVELYGYYRNYCYNNNLICAKKNDFFDYVEIANNYFKIGYPIIRKKVRIGEDNIQGFQGLGLK